MTEKDGAGLPTPYEGLRHETAMLCIDRAAEMIGKTYNDEDIPMMLRQEYANLVRRLHHLVEDIVRIDTLDKQRMTACYTVEGGKLVRMKLDDLLKLLQEQGGPVDI